MGSLFIGIIGMAAVVLASVNKNDWILYLNGHAIIIVIFGTIFVLALSNPSEVIFKLFKSIVGLAKPSKKTLSHWKEFDQLSKSRSLGSKSSNELVNYALTLWETGVTADMFVVLLSQKRQELETSEVEAVQALKNLAKYPPALGMTGTVIGLVSLFSKLGSGDKMGIGPALGLAMTATFFGLILANALLLPLADRLHVQHIAKKRFYGETFQILCLIHRGEPIDLVKGGGNNDVAA